MENQGDSRLSFISDCQGLVDRLAVTLPPKIQCGVGHTAYCFRRALGNLVGALEPDMTVTIVTQEGGERKIESWLSTIETRCRIEIAATAPPASMDSNDTFWTRDTLLVRETPDGYQYLQPRHDRGSEPTHGDWLSRHDNVPTKAIANIYLPGGDQILGMTARFVGHQSILETSRKTQSYQEAFESIDSLDNCNKTFVFGFHKADFDTANTITLSSVGTVVRQLSLQNRTNDEFHRLLDRQIRIDPEKDSTVTLTDIALGDDLSQWPPHLDLVLTAPGRTCGGREVVILARLVAADSTSPPGLKDEVRRLNGYLNATETRLQNHGFHVIRNDVPMLLEYRGASSFVARHYNNVILDGAPRTGKSKPLVWLPGYGEDEPALSKFDRRAAELWQELGFEPRLVQGWSKIVSFNGALRCATQVLARRS